MRTTRFVMLAPFPARRRSPGRRRPPTPASRTTVSPRAMSPATANVIARRWSSCVSIAAPRERPAALDLDRRRPSTRDPGAQRREAGRDPGDPVRFLVAQLAGARGSRSARSPPRRRGRGPGSRRSPRRPRRASRRSPGARCSGRPGRRCGSPTSRRRSAAPTGAPRSRAHPAQQVDDRTPGRVRPDVPEGELGVGVDRRRPPARRRPPTRRPGTRSSRGTHRLAAGEGVDDAAVRRGAPCARRRPVPAASARCGRGSRLASRTCVVPVGAQAGEEDADFTWADGHRRRRGRSRRERRPARDRQRGSVPPARAATSRPSRPAARPTRAIGRRRSEASPSRTAKTGRRGDDPGGQPERRAGVAGSRGCPAGSRDPGRRRARRPGSRPRPPSPAEALDCRPEGGHDVRPWPARRARRRRPRSGSRRSPAGRAGAPGG